MIDSSETEHVLNTYSLMSLNLRQALQNVPVFKVDEEEQMLIYKMYYSSEELDFLLDGECSEYYPEYSSIKYQEMKGKPFFEKLKYVEECRSCGVQIS